MAAPDAASPKVTSDTMLLSLTTVPHDTQMRLSSCDSIFGSRHDGLGHAGLALEVAVVGRRWMGGGLRTPFSRVPRTGLGVEDMLSREGVTLLGVHKHQQRYSGCARLAIGEERGDGR